MYKGQWLLLYEACPAEGERASRRPAPAQERSVCGNTLVTTDTIVHDFRHYSRRTYCNEQNHINNCISISALTSGFLGGVQIRLLLRLADVLLVANTFIAEPVGHLPPTESF